MVEIIDKSKKGYIYERHHIPTFRTNVEKQKFWEEENRRCIEGYGILPGTLYEYGQWAQIKDRTGGVIFYPQIREVDLYIDEAWAKAIREQKNLFLGKARGVGLSVRGCALANYYVRNFPGVNSLVTSKDASAIEEVFIEKVLTTYDNYPTELKPKEVKRTTSKNNCALRVQTMYYDEENRLQSNESKIVLRETSQNPASANNFSGFGAKYAFYDELPLHKRWSSLLRSSEFCFFNKHTNKKEGNIFSGGSFEDTLSNEDILSFMKFISNATTYKFNIDIIPFWMATQLDEYGRWDEKAALEWWDIEYEKIEKDKDLARAWRLNNPRSWADILELTSGSRFNDGINDLIKEQINVIDKLENETTVKVSVKLIDNVRDETQPIKTEPSTDNTLWLYEEPRPDLKYFATIDGTGTGIKSGNVEGSKWCTYIFKEYDPKDGGWCPVMKWLERPQDPPSAVRKSLLMARYYDKYGGFQKIWAEGNRGMESAYDLLMSKGYGRFISYKKNIEKGTTLGTLTPWQYIVDREYLINRASVFLEKHIGSIKDKDLLASMLQPLEENVDDFDSWLMMFIGYRFIDDERKDTAPAFVNYGKWVRGAGGIWVKEFSSDIKRDKDGNVLDEQGNIINDESFRKAIL